MMAAEALYLKENLVKMSDPVRPLQYHERTLHILPTNKCKMQTFMDQLVNYAKQHDMVINQHKTKAILFNQAKNYDFLPEIQVDGIELDVVEQIRVLGVTLRSDLSWSENTDKPIGRWEQQNHPALELFGAMNVSKS